jgi:thymidylate synthase
MFTAIFASDVNNGIGIDGKLPWKIRQDMHFFRETTTGHAVIMGRTTWESIGRPLPGRFNIIISSNCYDELKKIQTIGYESFDKNLTIEEIAGDPFQEKHVKVFSNPALVLRFFRLPAIKKIMKNRRRFIIGGETIYNWFFSRRLISNVYQTVIKESYKCDKFFSISRYGKFKTAKIINICDPDKNITNPAIYVRHLEAINTEECKILNLLNDIVETGDDRKDRTGIGTRSIFGANLEFSLQGGKFPLTTTRPVPFRHVFYELMWMIQGRTDNKWLNEKGIHIWDGNSTKEFLHKYKLPYEEGLIGPAYGHQMRYAGAPYLDGKADYTGKGEDQLMKVIKLIKTDPCSRRIMINLWNPAVIDKMALPPCAFAYQFYVSNKTLSCRLMQRSSDSLAFGWNIATASLLTIMLCSICDLKPKKIIWSPNDVHIYNNNIGGVKIQLTRKPRPFPLISVKKPVDNDITKFNYSDFKLLAYDPHQSIKFNMNA